MGKGLVLKAPSILIVALMLLLVLPLSVGAQGPPTFRFAGTVEVDGAFIGEGVPITASIQGHPELGPWAGETILFDGETWYRVDVPVYRDNGGCEVGDVFDFHIGAPHDLNANEQYIMDQDHFNDRKWMNASLTATTVPKAILEGQIDLQGRPDPPDASWVTPLTVTFLQDDVVVRTEEVTTDNEGKFTIDNVAPDTYDIGVKCVRTLSNLVSGVNFEAGATVPVDFRTLRDGDANNDDVITGADYSLLYTFFGGTEGEAVEKCDFNRNGVVEGGDYSLLWTNFGQTGDLYAV